MPAMLAWLDHSEAEQRRAREIIKFFMQPESRDELGIGGIRDALSNTLFPGTSMLLTRARYLLFIPWLYREGARRGHVGPKLTQWVEWNERQLIGALRNGGDLEGLIGRFAGADVRHLPSGIYWNTLRRFGILRREVTPGQIVGLPQHTRQTDDATEFLGHSNALWAPTLPPPPADFFDLERCDFALTRDEATWLAEQIVNAVPGTLLQFLVARRSRIADASAYAWEDPNIDGVTGRVRDALNEAHRFALAMHGAALLYNVLLAERAEKLGLSKFDGRREELVAELDAWRAELDGSDVGNWDLNGLWALVAARGNPASAVTRSFVTDWVGLARGKPGARLADDDDARQLIWKREQQHKRGQARLSNDRLMRQWGGASGSWRLTFRWRVVARLLNDMADGRENGRAGA
ncbi:MAG: DUF6361 family protein [Chloroflexi bacterium]|nr:DUF6361 family protein [Chloroflexota bacterium]